MSGKVIVKVLQGKDLKSQEWIGDNAPYCKVHPRSFGAQNAEWRSTVARAPQVSLGAANRLEQQWKRGKNPRWQDTAAFNFQYDRASSAEIELVCWHQVEDGEDKCIGRCTIKLELLLQGPADSPWRSWHAIYGTGRGTLHGTIELEISHSGGRPAQPAAQPAAGNEAGNEAGPTPAAAAAAPDVFFHIDPANNKKMPFSEADNALIRQARAGGSDSVRISDVRLPTGTVLQFEVRFKAPFGRLAAPPASGMAQVNIRNQNTRVVVAEKGQAAPAPAPDALADGWEEKKDPSSGRAYYVNKLTRQTQWDKPLVSDAHPPTCSLSLRPQA